MPKKNKKYQEGGQLKGPSHEEGGILVEAEGDEIIVRYKIAPALSKAGKSYVIASSRGRDTFSHDGKNIHVNFNAYVMKEEWEA